MNQPVTQSITTIPAQASVPEASADAPVETAAKTSPSSPTPSEGSQGTANGSSADTPGTEEKPDPDLEIARRFEGVARKEARARKLEVEWQTKHADLDAERKAFREEKAKFEAERDDWHADPIDWYLKNGKDPVEAARKFAQPETAESREIKKIREEMKRRDEAERQRQEEWQKQQAKMHEEQSMRAFVGSIAPSECPNLTSLYEPFEIPALVRDLLSRPPEGQPGGPTLLQRFKMEHGRIPNDAEIRECLEHEASLRATRILKRHRDSEAAQQATQSQEQVTEQAGPKGISNQHAATTSTGKQKPLSLEERRALARRELTAALETEAANRSE